MIAVIGSRNIDNYTLVESILGMHTIDRIVSGGAKGIDQLAERYSIDNSLPNPLVFKPDWKRYGRGAGIIRNRDIINSADHVIAIWDGKSKGTLDSINYAKSINKILSIYIIKNGAVEE